jgi:sugar phosphate isomerase/epimerase
MNNLMSEQSEVMSRRTFCRSAVTAAAAVHLLKPPIQAADTERKVKFYKNLGHGHIGVNGNQRQLLQYAVKYGFDSITPSLGEFMNKSESEIREWVDVMNENGIRYGAGGLSVQFRRDEGKFRGDMQRLPKQATVFKKMGVTRLATWIMPGHNELTYVQKFKLFERRFREVADVLKDYDIRLGLEFVGPRTTRKRFRFPFICTAPGMMELVQAIGTGNVGLLLDSWHWYTSHGTVEELLKLSNNDIVHVHVNDAPSGIEVDEQIDNRRKLPATTGVIDMKGFINAMVKIDYDGPVECEPFDQQLREMQDEAAMQKTVASLNRVWDLIEV